MAIQDAKRLVDGQLSFEGGQDGGRSPTRIGRNQSALRVNCSSRGDFIDQRPALIQCDLSFEGGDTQTHFEDGYFQGFRTFTHPGQDPTLLFSISGRILEVSLFPTFKVLERALPDANPTHLPQAWWEQVENTMVWQDGQSVPLLIGTGSVVRSDVQGKGGVVDTHPKKQVPTGRAMAYVNGRLWVTLPDEVSFVAGDIVGGPTGPLYFTENTFVNEGGTFRVPSNLGTIRAVRAMPTLDTSLGQGPIQFLCTDGIFSCNAPQDRTTWKDLTYPIDSVGLMTSGAVSDQAASLVNSDIWYRGRNGWYSFMIARRDFGMWSNTAMSHEVSVNIDDDSEQLLFMCSSVNWRNWMIGTCQPQLDKLHGIYHLGAVALDFSPITSISNREPPCWDGMWTGRKFMAFQLAKVQGIERCFAVILSDEGKIQLWELDDSKFFDEAADGTLFRIPRVIESPRFDFQNRTEAKLLDGQDHWAVDVRGTVDFNLFYRQDAVNCWYPWQSWQLCAKTEVCPTDAIDGCQPEMNLQPQPRLRVSAQRPPESCDVGTGSPSIFGYEFQTRLEIIGPCTLNAVRIFAQRVQEDVFGACPPETATTCPATPCCGPDNVVQSVPVPGTGGDGGGNKPDDVGACCIDGSCSITTRADCAASNGTFLGKGTTCAGDPCGTTPPRPSAPAWPSLAPLDCPPGVPWGPITVTDKLVGSSAFVAIEPGDNDPGVYVESLAAGSLQAWCNEVWSQFVASGTPFTQARLIWADVNLTGRNFAAWQVFPNQLGGYIPMGSLNVSILVEYCSP